MAYRRARDLYSQRRYRDALLEARNELKTNKRPSSSVIDLVDEICMHSAATGDVIGFDGRVLQVLPADPDTVWLGVHAELPQRQSPHTFNNIADALEAAADGDVIQLLPGTHIVSQVSLTVTKRVLIQGMAASAQQVVLDHRANHPAFTVSRSCVLHNFTIDMVGFCEAMSIIGSSSTVKPILRALHVSCSGDDGFSVGGRSQPLMQNCQVQVRKCGIKQYDYSSLTLWQCSFTNCQHAIMTSGSAQCFLEGCHILECSKDGIIGLEESSVHITGSYVTGCQGPGIDLSDRSGARLKLSEVKGCCGGVWLWNSATCEAIASHIDGGSSYAVLLDSQAYACGSSCTIDGPCHDSSEAPPPDNIKRSPTHSRRTSQEQPDLQDSRAPSLHKRALEAQGSSAAAAGRSGGGGAGPRSCSGHDQPDAKYPKTAGDDELQEQKWREPCSPFSTDSCSGSSLQSCADAFGCTSLDGFLVCSEDGSGRSCGIAPDREAYGACCHDKRLLKESMFVADAAAAAALFPPETGAFVYEPSLY